MPRDALESRPPVSVIIPLGPAERGLERLARDLLLLPADWEVLLVHCQDCTQPMPPALRERGLIRQLHAPRGRARQMNAGARQAGGAFLWFLHADSAFGPELVSALERSRRRAPEALIYCRLRFMPDGRGPLWLNQWGADLRSRWLGVPFGDQGFMLDRGLFQRLGGYDEGAAYGEDHLLVWQARRAGVALHECGAPLVTSARKYREQGWGRLTLRYQWLWLRQALPRWWQLRHGR